MQSSALYRWGVGYSRDLAMIRMRSGEIVDVTVTPRP